MRKFLPSTLAVMAWCSLVFSSLNQAKAQVSPVDPQTAAALQNKLDNQRAMFNLKGLSASVIIPGKGTWNGVSGISHAGVPLDTAMAFGYASITQNFTAAAILLLQEDGYLSLSDSVRKFLPPSPNVNPNITIRQLLQHTSGLFDYFAHPNWYTVVGNNPSQAMTPQFVLGNCVDPPLAAPGMTFNFSHTNYLLLGLIIEQITGQSYASFIRQHLLDPLQLSTCYTGEYEPATGVLSHQWSPPSPSGTATDLTAIPMTTILASSPATVALFGTLHDLARWGQLLFTGQVVQNLSMQMMTQFMPVNFGLTSGYGLGLKRYQSGTVHSWGMNGNIRGYSSCLMFSPADSIVVSLSSNQPSSSETLAWELMNAARQQLVTAAPHEVIDIRDELFCFPNPVQGKGSIKYTLQKAQPVEITLQNSLGQTVQTLLSELQPEGEYSLTVDTKTLSSGMYFCTLQTGDSKQVQPWVITR